VSYVQATGHVSVLKGGLPRSVFVARYYFPRGYQPKDLTTSDGCDCGVAELSLFAMEHRFDLKRRSKSRCLRAQR
jgi:hypothetical protein